MVIDFKTGFFIALGVLAAVLLIGIISKAVS